MIRVFVLNNNNIFVSFVNYDFQKFRMECHCFCCFFFFNRKADIALIGLAVMGQNLILNMDSHGFVVCAYNRTVDKVNPTCI